MLHLFQSKGQELIGNPCLGIGVRIGKATLTLMDRASLLRSPLVMDAPLSLTTLLRPVGRSARPSAAYNSHKTKKKNIFQSQVVQFSNYKMKIVQLDDEIS